MKKTGIFLIVFSVISLIILFLFYKDFRQEKDFNDIISNSGVSLEDKNSLENTSKEEIDSKIANLKKKIKLKGLITKANMYYDENEYMIALIEYQKILKDIPNDEEINSKIGDIYYKIHKYKKANEHYEKIKKSKFLDKQKAIFSLINDTGINKENLETLQSKIDEFNLSDEEKFYYKNSLVCVIDYSLCRDGFQKYFEKNKEFETEEMKIMFNAFEAFKNFKDTSLYYKAAFVTGAFYQNGFHYISLKTSENILSQKADYKPIMKVAAKSSYEIGDYISAKKYLNEIRKTELENPEISYFLARVHEKLNDKVLALINYQKALKDGHPEIVDIKRRIIFIYFETKDKKKMLKEFDDLLSMDSKNLTENDFSLGIYYNIIDNKLDKAERLSKKAIRTFKNSGIFYGYLSWIMLQNEDLSQTNLNEIKTNIDNAKNLGEKGTLIMMLEGIYESKMKNFDKAIIKLKNAYSSDKTLEYREIINLWIERINLEKNIEKSN